MTMSVINAVAEFERDLERTHAGLTRAKEHGRMLGRPVKLTAEQKRVIYERLGEGTSIFAPSREYGMSQVKIQRARDGAKAPTEEGA